MSHGSAWAASTEGADRQSLRRLLQAAKAADWTDRAAESLAVAIEQRVVRLVPSRLKQVLGADEACQLARAAAWERCYRLADDCLEHQTWNYLGTAAHRAIADAARRELFGRRLLGLTDEVPDSATTCAEATDVELGPVLETIVAALETAGCHQARRWIRRALDGRISRPAITERALAAGADQVQARALATLLLGERRASSVIGRIARGEPSRTVLKEPLVRRHITAVATGSTGRAVA